MIDRYYVSLTKRIISHKMKDFNANSIQKKEKILTRKKSSWGNFYKQEYT